MVATANPDYWTAVVGLCGAFIIAAAFEMAKHPADSRAASLYNWAFTVPATLAIFGLVGLGSHWDSPPLGITVGFGVVALMAEVFFLSAGHNNAEKAKAANRPTNE